MNMARIAILFDKQTAENRWKYGLNAFERYIGEVLTHAGIPFEWLDQTYHLLENRFDIVIAALMPNDEASLEMIRKYAEKGGTVVSYAGLNELARQFGFAKGETVAPGYADIEPAAAAWNGQSAGGGQPLRFLRAVPWIREKESDLVCEEHGAISQEPGGSSRGALLQRFKVGAGAIERWSVDIPGAIVGLQQGTEPVTEDGAPAPDGTAPLNDGILKAEDGLTLDWTHDRQRTETGAVYFAHPYADWWREAIVGQLLGRITETGKPLPFIGDWPDGVDKVAMISHDSDRNHDEDAMTTLEILQECGIRSSWCMMKPGYSAWVYPRVAEAGHELALHFNANPNEGGRFEEADFVRQYEWLRDTVKRKVAGNKNHFTRYEGWGELFRWCEQCGIEADQTRGPSKKGSVGFTFGTCLPYAPIALSDEHNRIYDVLEFGFLTQDIPHFTDPSVIAPFLETVEKVRGVAHFLFHQGRIHSFPEVRDSLRQVVEAAKGRGFVFWTGQEINDWVRIRRRVRIAGLNENGEAILDCPDEVLASRPAIWRPLAAGEEVGTEERIEHRFGVMCIRMKEAGAC